MMKTLRRIFIAITFMAALFIPKENWSQCTLACYSQINVSLDATGNATLTPEMVLVNIPGSCGTLTLSQSSFDCSDVGAPIVVTVTDSDSGNSCWFNVIIEDKTAPSITCLANLNISLPPSGTVDLTPAMLLVSESDNCPLTYNIVPASVSCADLGTPVNVVITATDPGGNSASCFTSVTVSNYNPPALACFSQVNISLDATGNATILPEYILGSPYPDCALVVTPNAVDCSDIGMPITVIVLDQVTGNSCWSTVIVEDKTAPTIACVSNVNVTLPVSGDLTLTPAMLLAVANDNCPLTYDISPSTVSCADVGTPVNVTITATDPGGNSSSCFSTVNVQYNPPPLACISTINISLGSTGEAIISPGDILAGPYQECAVIVSPNMVNCSDVGLPVFVTVLDQLTGNTCFSVVNVEDKLLPTITCNNQVNVSLNASGNAALTPEMLIVNADDNCDLAYTLSTTSVDCTDIGLPIDVTITATDSGDNVVTCVTTVIVEDKLAPTAICLSAINVSLGIDGTASITSGDVNAGSFDNCTEAANLTYSLSPSTFTCEDIGGAISVNMEVTDAYGNMGVCVTSVLVEDKLAPTPICLSNVNVSLGSDGTATLLPVDVNASSFDNCTSAANLTYSLSQSIFTCSDIGGLIPIQMHVTDESGNSDFCIVNVLVEDKLAPLLTCNTVPTNIQLGADGTVTITSDMVLDNATDNCDLTYTFSPSSFDCSDKNKTRNVVVTATDASGNTSTCTGSVTIENPRPTSVDIVPPALIICGQSGAVFSAVVTGGYGPFTYEWTIKGNSNGWSITSGQGTSSITMDVGIKKVRLRVRAFDVCGKKRKVKETFFCTDPENSNEQDGSYDIQSNQDVDLDALDFDIEHVNWNNQTAPISKEAIAIFPNPVMDRLEFSLDSELAKSGSKLYVIDQFGAISNIGLTIDSGVQRSRIDVSILQPGIYCLVMETNTGERFVKRFVKL